MIINKHIKQLKKSNRKYKTQNGKNIDVFEIVIPENESLILSWAKHFREQYCNDNELDELVNGTEYKNDKGKYLEEKWFPSMINPGPSILSGDFGEILLADYLEFTKKFWVPRNRINHKAIPISGPRFPL